MLETYEAEFQALIQDVQAAKPGQLVYPPKQYDGKGLIGQLYDCSTSLWFPPATTVLSLEFMGKSGSIKDQPILVHRFLEGHKKMDQPNKGQKTGVVLWLSNTVTFHYSELMFVPLKPQEGTYDIPWASLETALAEGKAWPKNEFYTLETSTETRYFVDRNSVARHLALQRHAANIYLSPNFEAGLKAAATQVMHEAMTNKQAAQNKS